MNQSNTSQITFTKLSEKHRPSLFWIYLVVLVSVVQYYAANFDRTGTLGILEKVYYLIMGTMIISVVAIIINRKYKNLFLRNLRHSPILICYSFWFLISQSLVVWIYGDLGYLDIFRALGYMFASLVAYTLFPVVIGKNGIRGWWTILLIIGTISSVFGIYAGITGIKELFGLRIGRQSIPMGIFDMYFTSGLFSESNMFGLAACIGLIAGLFLTFKARRTLNRFIALFLTGICAGGLFFSGSRQIYLGLFFGFWGWLLIGKSALKKLLLTLLFIISIMGAWYISWNIRIVNAIVTPSQGMSGRQYLWPAGISAMLDRPVTGYGVNSDLALEAIFVHGGYKEDIGPTAVHNGPLDLGVMAGFPAAILYISLFVISFRRLLISSMEPTTKRFFTAVMIVYIPANIFQAYTIGGISYGSLVFTISLGICNIAPMIYGRKENKKRKLSKQRDPHQVNLG